MNGPNDFEWGAGPPVSGWALALLCIVLVGFFALLMAVSS